MRSCLTCSASIEHKRSNAQYCDRTCKAKASDKRRVARDPGRDKRRYVNEAPLRIDRAKRYYYANHEKQVLYSRNYQHGARGFSIAITAREWRRLKARYHHQCAYCSKSGPLQMDHVVPLARGGRHAPANILPACASCNISKRDHFLSEWRLSQRREVNPTP